MLDKIYRLITRPEQTWWSIKQEPADLTKLFKNYALPLLLLPVLSAVVRSLSGHYRYLTWNYLFDLVLTSVVNYIMLAAVVLFAGWVVSLLARYFEVKDDLLSAMKVVVYSMTPIWLASVCRIFPRLSVLSLLGVYSAYLLFTALPIVLEAPPEKQFGLALTTIGFGVGLMMYLQVVIGGAFYY